MNLARKTQHISDTDPRSVLRAIGSNAGFDLNQASFEPAEASEQPASSAELMPLRINPDTNPSVEPEPQNVLEATVDSATQIQQLAIRLRQNELELEQREIELEERVKNLDQSALQQQSVYERRRNQIEQQASQIRCQQLHLMQLQTDIVKSHEATRQAIESLVVESGSEPSSVDAVSALQALKYELGGRFNYIARRWRHLAELMKKTRVENAAEQSIDDSVDWTGDLS